MEDAALVATSPGSETGRDSTGEAGRGQVISPPWLPASVPMGVNVNDSTGGGLGVIAPWVVVSSLHMPRVKDG